MRTIGHETSRELTPAAFASTFESLSTPGTRFARILTPEKDAQEIVGSGLGEGGLFWWLQYGWLFEPVAHGAARAWGSPRSITASSSHSRGRDT